MTTFRTGTWNGATFPAALGNTTRWEYDLASGLVTAKTDADGQTVRYRYSPDGKLLNRTWARGIDTAYEYHPNGLLKSVTYSDDTPDIRKTYNRLGQLHQVQDATGVRTFTFNAHFDLSPSRSTESTTTSNLGCRKLHYSL